MYSCDSDSTWATITDLYERYGEEFVDKLAIRRKWNAELGQYVADESHDSKIRVITLALCDAMALIKKKLACRFTNTSLLDEMVFPSIKVWHLRLTIETLKTGGDCLACACNETMEKDFDCGNICTEDGICLVSNKTAFSISKAHFPCECNGRCSCC
jgi:hypothetical protein